MSEVTVKNYPEWVRAEYRKFPEEKALAMRSMIAVLAQSYQMLMTWRNEHDYKERNDNACAAVWHEFCRYYKANKVEVKLIVGTQLTDIRNRMREFAIKQSLPTFNEWLDSIQVLSEKLAPEYDDRPFFSVVIACYNDGRYTSDNYLAKLLTSLCSQGVLKNDLEVILSDDCSPVSFDSIVESFKDKLNIVRVKTDYNFAPGNTRQKGVDAAKGHWLCFADHDDVYYANALRVVKTFIAERQEKLYVYSPFNGVNTEGKILHTYEQTMGWCHGKFYNVDNFWKPQGIHFIHDLPSHEDIAICTQVACALDTLKQHTRYKYLNMVTYAWTNNPNSVSHSKYSLDDEGGERNFLEVFFKDYLKSTGYIYLDLFNQGKLTEAYARTRTLEVVCYAYFYTQGFQFERKDFLKENLVIAGKYLNECKQTFHIRNNAKVYEYVSADHGAMYKRIRPHADRGVHYVPQQGFKQWLDLIDRQYKQSCTG